MNKGIFGFPERFRDESFHGFPKKKVSGESFFGFPSGSEDYDFKIRVTVANTTRAIVLGGFGPVIINWGDGLSQQVFLGGASTYSHTYPQIGDYLVKIEGDTLNINDLRITAGGLLSVRNDFSKFRNVTFLRLERGDLSTIPATFPNISTLSSLTFIRMNGSGWVGEFPKLTTSSLAAVYLQNNNLIGDISSLGLSLTLTKIELQNNKLSSGLEAITSLPNLNYLDISFNWFSGSLPSLSGLTSLATFGCFNNQFSGTLPSFSSNSALVTCNIYNNQFSGTLPSFNNLTSLVTFNCYGNKFSSNIPTFSGCTSLQDFYAGGTSNAWTGTVPYFPSSLKIFNLQYASSAILEFPYDVFDNLVYLTTINIRRVAIGGTKIFPNISNNVNLETLYITDNQNTETKFNNGTITFNTPKLTWFYCRNMDGVSLDFTNLQMLNSASYFTFSSASLGNIIYPLGSKIIGNNGMEVSLFDNGMSQANVDATIVNLFNGRNNFINTTTPKVLSIGGSGTFGTPNAAPSGTYQQPAGFTHDLTEGQIDTLATTVKEKIWILVNCQVSSVNTTKRYKWTITTN